MKGMDDILYVVFTGYVLTNSLTLLISGIRVIGLESGSLRFPLKLRILCGVCVEATSRLVFAFLTRAFNVLQTVLVVHGIMTTLLMLFSIFFLLSKFGKWHIFKELSNTPCHLLLRKLILFFCCWKLCPLNSINGWNQRFGVFGSTKIFEFGMIYGGKYHGCWAC